MAAKSLFYERKLISPCGFKGISKNQMSFRCTVDLVGRLHKKAAGILTCVKDFLCSMTAEDAERMSGRGFLEVPLSKCIILWAAALAE